MIRDYGDITKRITDPILWWDDHGCPRYDKYHPSMCGIYDDVSLLVEIDCQGCKATFQVAITSSVMDRMEWSRVTGEFLEVKNTEAVGKAFSNPNYGDPPRHDDREHEDCIGCTMSTDVLQIIEFWIRDHSQILSDESAWDDHGWKRHPGFEGKKGEQEDERTSTDQ